MLRFLLGLNMVAAGVRGEMNAFGSLRENLQEGFFRFQAYK